jgi:serine/threonine-protein kinase
MNGGGLLSSDLRALDSQLLPMISQDTLQRGVSVLKRTITVRQPRRFRLPEKGETISHGDRRYSIGEKLGRGGFGVVYECSDEWGNALVAKVILPHDRPYAEVRESWLQEAGKLMDLRHPNITFVRDAFEHQDTFYLIIERCNFPLIQVITSIGLDAERWLPYVARDVLQALDYIHAHGYIHKDLHPGNVFVVESRQQAAFIHRIVRSFKIGDLGLTRLETDVRAFQTRLAEWMRPPEIIDPRTFVASGRQIDIYQAGLLMLSLLLKEIPYFTSDEIVEGIPQQVAQDNTSPYAPVIARALRRHVEWRTQTALEFWRELSAVTNSSS